MSGHLLDPDGESARVCPGEGKDRLPWVAHEHHPSRGPREAPADVELDAGLVLTLVHDHDPATRGIERSRLPGRIRCGPVIGPVALLCAAQGRAPRHEQIIEVEGVQRPLGPLVQLPSVQEAGQVPSVDRAGPGEQTVAAQDPDLLHVVAHVKPLLLQLEVHALTVQAWDRWVAKDRAPQPVGAQRPPIVL